MTGYNQCLKTSVKWFLHVVGPLTSFQRWLLTSRVPPLSLGIFPSFLPGSPILTPLLISYFILSNPFHGASCVNNRDRPSMFSESERKRERKNAGKTWTQGAHCTPSPRWSMALCLCSPALSAGGTLLVQLIGWFCLVPTLFFFLNAFLRRALRVLSILASVFMLVCELSVTIAPCKYWPSWIATVSSLKANTACHARSVMFCHQIIFLWKNKMACLTCSPPKNNCLLPMNLVVIDKERVSPASRSWPIFRGGT